MPAVGGDQLCANSPRSDSDYAEWLSMADGRPQLPAVRQHRPCRRCRFLPPQRRRLPSFGFNRGKTRQGAAPTDPPSAFASRRSPVRSRYAPHASRRRLRRRRSLRGGNPVSPVCPLVMFTRFPRRTITGRSLPRSAAPAMSVAAARYHTIGTGSPRQLGCPTPFALGQKLHLPCLTTHSTARLTSRSGTGRSSRPDFHGRSRGISSPPRPGLTGRSMTSTVRRKWRIARPITGCSSDTSEASGGAVEASASNVCSSPTPPCSQARKTR